MNILPNAQLILEDGSTYPGRGFGVADGRCVGELVFHTGATGYQEILTDPSYRGQIVMMTTPEVGNYGVNPKDVESERVHVAGFVVRRLSPIFSSWRGHQTLDDYLKSQRVVGIQGVDTRALTRKVREQGAMKAGIVPLEANFESALAQVKNQLTLDEQDLVSEVTTRENYTLVGTPSAHKRLGRLVVVDFGIKQNILCSFQPFVDEIIVLPAKATFEQIQVQQPDAVFLSNGPGDPRTLEQPVAMAKDLVASGIPTFGICLGHQILALASGASIAKMAFGHHGANHPVKDLLNGTIAITSQNHGYAVDEYDDQTLEITHVNLYDQSIEGFRHRNAPVMSIQFHPEASPGPHDAQYLFANFVTEVLRTVRSGSVPAL